MEQREVEFALVTAVGWRWAAAMASCAATSAMGRAGDWREISISLSISTSLACQVKDAAKSRGINRVIQ